MGHIVELEARDGGGRIDGTALRNSHPTRKAHKEAPCVRTQNLTRTNTARPCRARLFENEFGPSRPLSHFMSPEQLPNSTPRRPFEAGDGARDVSSDRRQAS
jgi:hypothetical protein